MQEQSWSAPFEDNTVLHAYFNTLPKMVQELLVQSNAQVSCVSELRRCVQELQSADETTG